MRSSTVTVLDVDAQHALEMTTGEDEQPVEALLPDRPHPSFRHRVPSCSHQAKVIGAVLDYWSWLADGTQTTGREVVCQSERLPFAETFGSNST
jgi:hypothetical protein